MNRDRVRLNIVDNGPYSMGLVYKFLEERKEQNSDNVVKGFNPDIVIIDDVEYNEEAAQRFADIIARAKEIRAKAEENRQREKALVIGGDFSALEFRAALDMFKTQYPQEFQDTRPHKINSRNKGPRGKWGKLK